MPSISYHVLMDNITPDELSKLNFHLIRLQPEYINITGGSRFNQALQYVEQLSNIVPNTKVILRKWPDDGILARYNYDAHKWYEETIKPLEWWLMHQRNIIWMLDNESTSNDLRPYAAASSLAMDLCYDRMNLPLAVGRFATGNPREDQYTQLDTMWDKLRYYDGFHIFSPNEYFEKPSYNSGIGSIGRYKLAHKRCQEKFGFTPKTVIGEFGLAVNYQSDKGWRSTALSETDYAKICIDTFNKNYLPDDITACLFSVGKWNGFEIEQTFFNQVETQIPVWNKPIVITPEKEIIAIAIEDGIRIREKPVIGKTIGYVNKHDYLTVLENKTGIGENGKWLKIKLGNKIGYTAAWYYVTNRTNRSI